MSGPDQPNWQAVKGSGEIPAHERAVLDLPAKRREARRRNWQLALVPMVGGLVMIVIVDLLVWLMAGAPAYIGMGQGQPTTLLALLATPIYAIALWCKQRIRLLALTWCLPTMALIAIATQA